MSLPRLPEDPEAALAAVLRIVAVGVAAMLALAMLGSLALAAPYKGEPSRCRLTQQLFPVAVYVCGDYWQLRDIITGEVIDAGPVIDGRKPQLIRIGPAGTDA